MQNLRIQESRLRRTMGTRVDSSIGARLPRWPWLKVRKTEPLRRAPRSRAEGLGALGPGAGPSGGRRSSPVSRALQGGSCRPANRVPGGRAADGGEFPGWLALCSLPCVLTHFVVIRYRCFTQLSLKIQVYCEIEVSLQRRRSRGVSTRSPRTTPLPAGTRGTRLQ